MEMELPGECLVIIERKRNIIPKGRTKMQEGDVLSILYPNDIKELQNG